MVSAIVILVLQTGYYLPENKNHLFYMLLCFMMALLIVEIHIYKHLISVF